MDVTPEELLAMRLANLRLSVAGESPADVAEWCGALQAQDLASGKWSLGVRLPGSTEAEVDAAFDDAEVLRTWPMRGTIHIVHPRNARWMVELTGRRALMGLKARWDYLGLDKATVDKAADVLAAALKGRRLTRSQCLQVLEDAGIDTSGQRSYHLLWHTAQIGITCIGPNEGNEQTFVLLDEWAPHPLTPDRDEALAMLATMYFRSHGPATRDDFVRWTGLTAADASSAIALADLTAVGATMFTLPADAPRVPDVLLLPGFDEFMLGYRDRSLYLEPEHLRRVVPGGNGMFKATLVEKGRITGVWHRKVLSKTVRVTVSPFGSMSAARQAAVEGPAQAYAAYVGKELDLRFA